MWKGRGTTSVKGEYGGANLGEVAGMTWAGEEYVGMSWELRVSFHVDHLPTRF